MMVNTNTIVPMTDANRDFSKVERLVDENGMAVIIKNDKPRYIVVDFDEYNSISVAMQMRKEMISAVAEKILDENIEAFTELAR